MGELTVAAKQEQLERVQLFVGEQVRGRLTARATHKVLLAVEEIFVNIARYAYPQGSGEATILCETGRECVSITFQDAGIPYNPLAQKQPDITLSAAERPVGGLGIYLTRELMDSMSYRWEGGRNILCLEKRYERE